MNMVKELTIKEEEVMNLFWAEGPLFVKQLVDKYPDPKPHFNTLSTYVRFLEEKGYLSHEELGPTYRYYPIITEEQYRNGNLKNVVRKYFDNSYLHVVSSLIKENDITVEEIRKLLEEVEKTNNNK